MNLPWPARLFSSRAPRSAIDGDDAVPIFPWALRRDVLVVIALKLAALAAIYWLFFLPHERAEPRAADVAAQILDH